MGDGYQMLASEIVIQNDQTFYCSGGDGDGYNSKSSGITTSFIQSFYCSGGIGDGYQMNAYASTINDQVFYCNSGDGDGYFMLSTGVSAPNDASFYCAGGDADGYGKKYLFSTINDQLLYCSGDSSDGYHMQSFNAAINDQDFYCSGGNADGYQFDFYNGSIFGNNLFCLGGDGDGYELAYTIPSLLGIGIWNGISSTDWNTNTNWKHDSVPTSEHNVMIPTTCANYPVVDGSIGVNFYTGSVRCSGLTIEQGASLTNSGYLFLAGNMLVEGSYTNNYFKTRSQRVLDGGSLIVSSTGNVILGNQTTENGRADLLIYDGGTVFIDGGLLQVDDQLHVKSGGTLNMTGGDLVVHKYGEGTPFGTYNPCNFWIESGAIGEMSGGVVKVSGRETDGIFVAVRIGEPTFLFNGTHTFIFQHGDYPIHYDPAISTADGVSLQNLTINKPGNTVFVADNLAIKGELTIQSGSSIELENGIEISVGE